MKTLGKSSRGPTRSSVVLRNGTQVDLRVVSEASYGAALQYFTGSKAHKPRRIGEAVKRAFHGEIEDNFEKDGYFVRVNWTREAEAPKN
jgi:DNA polymerase/3'-5' exonuclease PolX